MKLDNAQLGNFIARIKLHRDDMGKYRTQMNNLRDKLKQKIQKDEANGVRVSRFLIAGSWKKHTILRPRADHPIDLDLVLFIEGDESLRQDVGRLHDFVVSYLEQIYPTKDIYRDVDAEGKTKSIKIVFIGTGLEADIVPVVPLSDPVGYVWQPERGGGGRYITSVDGQLAKSADSRQKNGSYTSIVRAAKWWRNYKELKAYLSSFVIELIVAHLDDTQGISQDIEEGLLRFFDFVSRTDFPIISFPRAINQVPVFTNPVFIADPTNNENNTATKLTNEGWAEVQQNANEAFEALSIAQSRRDMGSTLEEWKEVFGPTFNIEPY